MNRYKIGRSEIDPGTRRVVRDGKACRLSPKAMAVLELLVAADGRVVSRADLLDGAWPDVTVGEEVLTHSVAELRRALGDSSRAPRHIETVHKSGYRLLGAAEPLDGAGVLAPPAALAPPFDIEVYLAYLNARKLFETGGRDNALQALAILEGVDVDRAGFALALALKSVVLTYCAMYYSANAELLRQALETAAHAVRIDPSCPEAHSAYGLILSNSGGYGAAAASFQTAVRLNPNCFDTHYLFGRASLAAGADELAATMLDRASSLRADYYHPHLMAAKALRRLGREKAAQSHIRAANLSLDLHIHAQDEEMLALCDKVYCLMELGEKNSAYRMIDRIWHRQDPMKYYLAAGLARAGDVSAALDCLEACADSGLANLDLLARDPDLESLRGERRFRQLSRALLAA